MIAARLSPVFLSYLLLAAHFLRYGDWILVIVSLGVPALLALRNRWTARLVIVGLLLGTFEWVRTLNGMVLHRQVLNEPWTRLALILGTVAAFTLLSATVFRQQVIKDRYSL